MHKENILVTVRVRPLNAKESARKEQEVIKTNLNRIIIEQKTFGSKNLKKKEYFFSQCYGPEYSNSDIHQQLTKDIVLQSLRGINSTIFVYGQTGSGKTYTITGDVDFEQNIFHCTTQLNKSKSPLRKQRPKSKSLSQSKISKNSNISQIMKNDNHLPLQKDGIVFHSLQEMFSEINSSKDENFVLKCSYIEIYKEQVYDLLRHEFEEEVRLQIYEDIQNNEFQVKNAIEEYITSYEEAIQVIQKGERNRHFAVTNMNHNSSRSHTIFRIFIEYIDKEQVMYSSICNFVDLAGSERLSKYDGDELFDKNSRMKESKSINKSLFFLTHIINLISKNQPENFIPFRNSPLTKILKNSLGGNSKTAIILCINPSVYNLEQTLSTLKFGNLASCIQNRISKNLQLNPEVNLERLIKEYEEKLKTLNTSGIEKDDTLQKRLQELEEQKRIYMNKYQNLLKLNEIVKNKRNRTSFIDQKNTPQIDHLYSCGIIDYYGRKKFDNEIGNSFLQNQSAVQEVLSQDIVRAKNDKINKLEEKLDNQKQLNIQLKFIQERIIQENNLFKRLLEVFLNQNEKDLQSILKNNEEQLLQNALLMIENVKTQSIQLEQKSKFESLSYKKLDNQKLSINKLIENLGNHYSSIIQNDVNYSLNMGFNAQGNVSLQEKPRQMSYQISDKDNNYFKEIDNNVKQEEILENSFKESQILNLEDQEYNIIEEDRKLMELLKQKENMQKKITKKFLLSD